MTYRDPDSGLEFASYDAYVEERTRFERWSEDRWETAEATCAAGGHAYHGDDCGVGRCFCGEVTYPAGGP